MIILPQAHFDLMDQADAWTSKVMQRTLELGARYLYDEAERIEPGSPLSKASIKLGNSIQHVRTHYYQKGLAVPADQRDKIMAALDLHGNLGYALWKLRAFRSAGYDFELKQLAQWGGLSGSSKRLLRSHGSLFHFASRLAVKSFAIEFCLPGAIEGPDFIASIDGASFPCEVTTKDPEKLKAETVEEYWRHVHNAIRAKRGKFDSATLDNGVLLIDCTPIAHLIQGVPLRSHEVASMDANGTSGRVDRVVRYDGSAMAEGVRRTEVMLQGSRIRNLALRNWLFTTENGRGERLDLILVLGTLEGRGFWKHFNAPLILPGPSHDAG